MPQTTYSGINLDTVLDILNTATKEAERLALVELAIDFDSQRTNKAETAEVTRDLLYLSDALAAASVLVKSEYWHLKGKALVP